MHLARHAVRSRCSHRYNGMRRRLFLLYQCSFRWRRRLLGQSPPLQRLGTDPDRGTDGQLLPAQSGIRQRYGVVDDHALTFSESILAEAIVLTGVARYRFLALEHPDPQTRAEYQRLVTEIASGTYAGQRVETPAEGGGCSGCPGSGYD